MDARSSCYDAAMRRARTLIGSVSAAALLMLGVAACGNDTRIPQTVTTTPFAAASVTITQQGNASVTIDPASVTFMLDDSRGLVAHLTVRSRAASTVTITVRGSIYDPQHRLIGDVSGGQINVATGQVTTVQLTGPTPLGTIASAVFEVTAVPFPT